MNTYKELQVVADGRSAPTGAQRFACALVALMSVVGAVWGVAFIALVFTALIGVVLLIAVHRQVRLVRRAWRGATARERRWLALLNALYAVGMAWGLGIDESNHSDIVVPGALAILMFGAAAVAVVPLEGDHLPATIDDPEPWALRTNRRTLAVLPLFVLVVGLVWPHG